MTWEDAIRLAQVAQDDPEGETIVVWVGEAPSRYFVTFQPAPIPLLGKDVIPMVVPNSGQWAVDKETGAVEGFTALPGQPEWADF